MKTRHLRRKFSLPPVSITFLVAVAKCLLRNGLKWERLFWFTGELIKFIMGVKACLAGIGYFLSSVRRQKKKKRQEVGSLNNPKACASYLIPPARLQLLKVFHNLPKQQYLLSTKCSNTCTYGGRVTFKRYVSLCRSQDTCVTHSSLTPEM